MRFTRVFERKFVNIVSVVAVNMVGLLLLLSVGTKVYAQESGVGCTIFWFAECTSPVCSAVLLTNWFPCCNTYTDHWNNTYCCERSCVAYSCRLKSNLNKPCPTEFSPQTAYTDGVERELPCLATGYCHENPGL